MNGKVYEGGDGDSIGNNDLKNLEKQKQESIGRKKLLLKGGYLCLARLKSLLQSSAYSC